MVACLNCQKEFATEGGLHRHLHVHEMDMGIYYRKYFPRYDKLTGDLIRFIDKDQYFSADFNDIHNFQKWIFAQPKEAAQEYCCNLLLNRKRKKGLIYSPSQVELRSLEGPSMVFLNPLFGNYYDTCAKLGFKNKFKLVNIPKGFTLPTLIETDTREQTPIQFDPKYVKNLVTKKLDFGDYRFSDGKREVFFERKTMEDLMGTMSNGFDRFKREIQRAKDNNSYLVIVVEARIKDVLNFNKNRALPRKITPAFILRNVRTLIQEFENCQFLFVTDRTVARRVMFKVFSLGEEYKNIDLQYYYEKGDFYN